MGYMKIQGNKNLLNAEVVLKLYRVLDYLLFEENVIKKYFLTIRSKMLLKKIINKKIVNKIIAEFFKIKEQLLLDLKYFYESDPSAISLDEIKISFPGFKAIKAYRIAHVLYRFGYKVSARIISEEAHSLTGIDINPGCNIGCPFFIDHGTGVVIGETASLGNYVKIYQGVTLGAISLKKGQLLKNRKRHPTILDNVTIYSGASIFGGETVIGNNVVIGANTYITSSVDDNNIVTLKECGICILKK